MAMAAARLPNWVINQTTGMQILIVAGRGPGRRVARYYDRNLFARGLRPRRGAGRAGRGGR